MNVDELKACIQKLRERRESIPALRDYRPQRKGSNALSKDINIDDIFSNIFSKEEDPTGTVAPGEVTESSNEKGGES